MNRFDYFSDIEDTFVRRRGKALFLSPLDWELMQSWSDKGVPLHVVLRSIESVFDKHEAKAPRRPIASLSYCKNEVEAQYAEWLEGQVGSHAADSSQREDDGDRNPFAKDAVIAYLRATREELFKCTEAPEGLKIAILHVTEKLSALITGLHVADRIDARMMEFALSTLEAILNGAIEAVSTPAQLAEARAAAEALYGPYKDKMPEKVYDEQIERELKKRLREIFGVPRLSLFHMK